MPLEIVGAHPAPAPTTGDHLPPQGLVVAHLGFVGVVLDQVPAEVFALGAAAEGGAVGAFSGAGVVVLVFSTVRQPWQCELSE
jgi:hypothetical protein